MKKLKNEVGLLPKVTIDLTDGYKAPVDFYDAVAQQVRDVLPAVHRDKFYTLKELCGEVFWSILKVPYVQRLAGRCFADMVVKGVLPFEFVQYKKSRTKHYVLL